MDGFLIKKVKKLQELDGWDQQMCDMSSGF